MKSPAPTANRSCLVESDKFSTKEIIGRINNEVKGEVFYDLRLKTFQM